MEIRHACFPITQNGGKEGGKHEKSHLRRPAAVSYTHLTLPTNSLV